VVSAFLAFVWGTPLSLACTMIGLLSISVALILLYAHFMKSFKPEKA
jgi:hypothetical protein